jgi:zinc transport system ATP-binding protein
MNNQIEVKHVSVKYGNHTVLDDVSFSIKKGDYIGLVGANGSGKTTLVKSLLGLIDIEKGEIVYANPNIKRGYLPQIALTSDSLFPAEVKEIVGIGLLSGKIRPKIITKLDLVKIDAILERLSILDLKHKRIGDLSGGQQQRVLLARAMVNSPELLILDEPTSALDPRVREDFYTLIKEINTLDGTTVILVSHDLGSVQKYAKKMLVIDRNVLFFDDVALYANSHHHVEAHHA